MRHLGLSAARARPLSRLPTSSSDLRASSCCASTARRSVSMRRLSTCPPATASHHPVPPGGRPSKARSPPGRRPGRRAARPPPPNVIRTVGVPKSWPAALVRHPTAVPLPSTSNDQGSEVASSSCRASSSSCFCMEPSDRRRTRSFVHLGPSLDVL